MRFIRELFSDAVALDLGTVNTLAAVRGRGIVLREASAVAVSSGEDKEIVELGSRAMLMLGRTPGQLMVSYPMRDGVISDLALAEAMIRFCIEGALGRRRRGLLGIRLALCLPMCVNDVERRALIDAARSAGARDMVVLSESISAAIGAGLPVNAPVGSMVVDIGGGTTDVAVVALGGIAAHRSIKTGGTHLDRAIVEYVLREYRIAIGERTAEQVKITLGSALMGGEERMTIRGRSLESGLPESVTLNRGEISYAIMSEVKKIVTAVKDTLTDTPPELAADLMSCGMTLTGGGAKLNGLDEILRRETGMQVRICEDAEDCVVLGALKALDMQDSIECVQQGLSA